MVHVSLVLVLNLITFAEVALVFVPEVFSVSPVS